jgi:hypothetical protein
MSIFSSCDEAPNSGVITYSDTSECATIAASPWPMPGVSTTTRSAPQATAAAITSSRQAGTSLAVERVASDRKNTCGESIAFIRIRSPSSAPPPRRRVGSIATTATRTLSSWSRRSRRTSSSVSDDLPDPPVPVMPSTGTSRAAATSRTSRRTASGTTPASSEVIVLASARTDPPYSSSTGTCALDSATSHSAIIELIMPASPMRWPSSGEKMRATPYSCSARISSATMTPPPPP